MPSNCIQAPFEQLLNFRDCGTTVNNFSKNSLFKPRLLFRSARPDFSTQKDRTRLTEEFGIRTVIDLRSRTEHIESAKKLDSSNAEETKPGHRSFQLPGTRTAAINLNGKGFERHLVWKLGYYDLIKLVLLMLFGYRIQAIRILGKNVLQPRGLNGLAQDTIEHSKPEIKEVFTVFSDPDAYPVLVHCTQGKDRTGLIVLLVLLLCEVPVDAISHDYLLSEVELEPEFEERMEEISSIGLDESFAKCTLDFASSISQYLMESYGGVQRYLELTGITHEQLDTIKSTLMV